MSANELLELTTLLKVVLWIEVIVYMGIGILKYSIPFQREAMEHERWKSKQLFSNERDCKL